MPKPRRSGGRLVISALWNSIVPASGFSSPAIMRNVVVFPQPDGPSSPKNSPWATSSDTSATARVDPKLRDRFFSDRKGIFQSHPQITQKKSVQSVDGFSGDRESQCPSILTTHSHSSARDPNPPACA